MQPAKPNLLVKPTPDTKFHIDYEWWQRSEEDLRLYMLTHLSPEKRDELAGKEATTTLVDYIHPQTGEVFQLDELGCAIQDASQSSDFINAQTPLVDSVFRIFLKNGNHPQTPRELATVTGRDANTILKTLGGTKIYKGIRPYVATTSNGSDA